MSAHDRQRWDTRYSEQVDEPYPEPDPLLFRYTPVLLPGENRRALDLAGGLGQNALWLAEQGYTVDLMDISRVALRRAQEETLRRGLRTVNFFQVDFDDTVLQPEAYDLICVFRFLNSTVIPQLRAAVKAGGLVVYETFNRGYLNIRPTFQTSYLLEAGELVGYFGDWRVIYNAELKLTSQAVAVKPE